MLGQHPQMYGLPELNLFLADTLQDLWMGNTGSRSQSVFGPLMRHGLLRTVAQLFAGEQTIESVQMARNWIWVRREQSTADVYWELLEHIAPLVPVEKSPAYGAKPEYLERLIATFPNARFLHLLRHPRGQCESVMKVAGGAMARLMDSFDRSGPEPVIDPQIAWHDFHLTIQEFLDQLSPGQYLRLHGEDFLRDTDAALEQVCQWLDLRSDAEALQAMRHPEDSPYACVGPANATLGNDINFLRSPALRPTRVKELSLEGPLSWRPDGQTFFPEVVELAQEYGYQ